MISITNKIVLSFIKITVRVNVILKITRFNDKCMKVVDGTTHKIVRIENISAYWIYVYTHVHINVCMIAYFTALYQLQRKLENAMVTKDD
jgi:hypothetical protein